MMRALINIIFTYKKSAQLKHTLNELKGLAFHLIDILLVPLTVPYAFYFKLNRKKRFRNFPLTKYILFKVGVFPILDHYYEPLYNPKHLKKSLRMDRELPGIDFNIKEQLDLLDKFDYNDELLQFPINKTNDKIEFCYNIGPFCSGDAEYLYNIIRHFKSRKIIEIGSGSSTLMAINAIDKNKQEDLKYSCEHVCIEPFENKWLEKCNVQVIRKLVEDVDKSLFLGLNENDILFIDSSHIIRPQGDVLYEYSEILPIIKTGVLIHIHDIFTPKDYLDEWINNSTLWNEQYLLEAFLTFNNKFRIIGATNYLMHHHYEQFSAKCPILKSQINREPGSFWIVKN